MARKQTLFVLPSTTEDALIMSMKLRAQDMAELQAIHGFDVNIKAILVRAVRRSVQAYTARDASGQIVLMFGVSFYNQEENVGCPWALSTDSVSEHARCLVHQGRGYVAQWKKKFTRMINFVHAQNSSAIHWIHCLGFNLHEAVFMGPRKETFIPFTFNWGDK